jgi:hypothetical protein
MDRSAANRMLWASIMLTASVVTMACSSSSTSRPTTSISTSTSTAASAAPSVGSSPTTTSTTAVTGSTTPTDSTFPTPSSTPETFTAALTFGTGPFTLTQPKAGLADLASYTATLALTFDGTRDGKPSTWTKTYTLMTSKSPAISQLTVDSSGDLTDLARVVRIDTDGVSYEKLGDSACNATVADVGQPPPALFEPAAALTSVIGADPAGNDTVDGTPADHYTFDEKALGQAGQATSKGDMWVATTGGYIVKFNVTTSAKADYFGEGIEGTATFNYAITGVNQPPAVAMPADCPPGLVNMQPLPDASDVVTTPGSLSFNTASSVADVAAFYQAEIPKAGWTLTTDPAVTDTSTELDFSQGSVTLTVLISTNASVTSVDMLLSTEPTT